MEQEDGKTGREDQKTGRETGRFRDGSDTIVGACIEVHRHLGPGLLESAYEECLVHELSLRGLRFERQRAVPLEYKGMRLECGYRLDLVVEDAIVVEIKAVDQLLPVHKAQLLTYLRLTGYGTGLLVNFHEKVLRAGLRRLTLSPTFPPTFPSSDLPFPSSRLPVTPPHSDSK